MPTATDQAAFDVPELCCSEEMTLLERGLSRLPGIEAAQPDYVNRTIRVEFHPDKTNGVAIARAIENAGFLVRPHQPARVEVAKKPWRWRITTAASGVLLAAAASARLLAGETGPVVATVLVISALVAGLPVLRAAVRAVRLRALDMNVLMTIAAVGAVAIGDYFEAATAMFLFAISLWLESHSMDRARRSVASLLALAPTVAHRVADGQIVDVEPSALAVGDRVLVRPGERVPIDGVVVQGRSSVNQAPITGESVPVEKSEGESVFAGSLNEEGSLQVRAERTAETSTLAHIARLVAEAEARRAPTERFVDRFARRYTPAVIALAVVLAFGPPLAARLGVAWAAATPAVEWFHRGLVLLVIACPCALVISTPVTIVCGLFQASRRGILIKGGEHLEMAGRIDAVALDKTGTLTTGSPRVADILLLDGGPAPRPTDNSSVPAADHVLQLAAALESHSEHPLAQAIVREARRRDLRIGEPDDFRPLRGFGVEGTVEGRRVLVGSRRLFAERGVEAGRYDADPTIASGSDGSHTSVFVGDDRSVWAAIRLADPPRHGAAEALRSLRRAGVHTIAMLTGDSRAVADSISRQLGLDEAFAELTPDEKVRRVQALAARYPRLAMVGDGVNDAPALAAAPLGIALGRLASDTALQAADIVVMSPSLGRLAELIQLGRRCRRILWQNISLALAVKAAVLLLAAFGTASLWMAVFADVGTSLLVISNGLRLVDRRSENASCAHSSCQCH